MVSPQIENGYTRIANELLEALCKINLSAYESRILWTLIRKTYGFQKKTDRISLSQFSKETGLDRRHAHRALRNLEMRKVIVTYRGDKRRPTYCFQKDYVKWKGLITDKVVTYRDDKVSPIEMTKLSPIEAPTKERKETEQKKGARFMQFYQSYPNKVAKKKAYEAWQKLEKSEDIKALLPILLDAIGKQKQAKEIQKAKGEFVSEWPYPATWLNGKRWEDEIEIKQGYDGF